MAECLVTGSIDVTCDDLRKVGGVKTRAWRVTGLEGFSFTVDGSGYVTALAFDTYQGLVRLRGPKNSHSGGSTPQVNPGGSRYFLHQVTINALNSDPADDEVLEEWLVNEGPVILETNNNEFFLYGAENGMTATADGGQNTGQDFTGADLPFTYNLEGAEKKLPRRILATDYASTLALLESYEID